MCFAATAIKKLKMGKVVGSEEMVAEFKEQGGDVVQVIFKLFSEIFETGKVPEEWRQCRVELIHGGGGKDKADIVSYRPVSIINVLNNLSYSA